MRLVYAVRLDLAVERDPDAVWARALDWIRRRDRSDEARSVIDTAMTAPGWHELSAGESLRFDCPDPLDGRRLREVQWRHPDIGDPTILWNPEVTLLSGTDGHVLFVTLRTGSAEFIISPGRHGLGTPRLVRDIVRDLAPTMRGWPLTPTVAPLSVENVTPFLSELKSQRRTIPYVVVTRSDLSDAVTSQLERRLMGLARVFRTTDKWAEYALGDDLGRPFGCFNGAVRVYWPGLDTSSEPRHHPLHFLDRIGDPARFSDSVLQQIANVAAFRHSEPRELNDLRSAIRNRELAELKERAEASRDPDEFLNDIAALERDRNRLRERVLDLQAQLDTAHENMRAIETYSEEAEAAADEASDEPNPQTVLAAVEFAQANLSNVHFLPTARASAAASPYEQPLKAFHALQAIDDVASVWIKTLDTGRSSGRGWHEEFKARGFDYAAADSREYSDERTFSDDGQLGSFEEHLRLGTSRRAEECLRIHFTKDEQRRKVVIAYMGEHLRTRAT